MEFSTFIAKLQVSGMEAKVDERSLYQEMQKVSDRRAKRGLRYTAALVLTIILVVYTVWLKFSIGRFSW